MLRARGIVRPDILKATPAALEQLGVKRNDILTARNHANTTDEALTLHSRAAD